LQLPKHGVMRQLIRRMRQLHVLRQRQVQHICTTSSCSITCSSRITVMQEQHGVLLPHHGDAAAAPALQEPHR
jgi:tRNA(Phe) wybutosine-synthesizing methylase Tyw3